MTASPNIEPGTAPFAETESSTPAPPRSRWPWPVQALIAVVLLFVALGATAPISLIPGVRKLEDPDAPMVPAVAVAVGVQLVVLVVAIAAVALVARLDGGRRLRDLGWRWNRRSLPALGLGILISAAVVTAVGIPLTAAGVLRPDDAGIAGEPIWAVLTIGLARAFVLQGIPEELIFRGYLLTSLRMRPVSAVLVSGLTFGVLHLVSSGGQQGWTERVMYLAMPIGFGLAAGALMLTTRSLWAAVGVHGGLHLTLLILALLESRGSPASLGNGPALWLLTGLAWTAIAAALMVRLARRSQASGATPPAPPSAPTAA